jgi:diguanylate cyclase (GGDEF)-like protein
MNRRFDTTLLLGVILFVATTVGLLLFVFEGSTRDALTEASNERIQRTAGNTAARADAFLTPVQNTAERAANLLDVGVVAVGEADALERFLLEQVRHTTDTSAAYVGTVGGDFVFATSLRPTDERIAEASRAAGGDPDVGWWLRRIVTDPVADADRWTQLDESFAPTVTLDDPTSTYDPRERGWFAAALDQPTAGAAWSAPYCFASSLVPGITASAAAEGGAEVVGVDVPLTELGRILDQANVTANGAAYLIDGDGDLVAVGEPSGATSPEGSTSGCDPAEPTLAVGSPRDLEVADAAVGAVADAGAPVARFDLDDEAWSATVAPLESVPGWQIVVTNPQQDVVAPVVDLQRRNTLLSLLIGLGIVLLAVPLVRLVARRVARVERRATSDALTELPNRRGFEEAFGAAFSSRRRGSRALAVAVVDVDEFKQINDRWGHATGDVALRAIAGRLKHNLRDGDVVARFGGDEFAALLVGADEDEAADVLDRARALVAAEPVSSGDDEVPVAITIGVAALGGGGPVDGEDRAETALYALLAEADAALYVAKRAGRNRVATSRGVIAAR